MKPTVNRMTAIIAVAIGFAVSTPVLAGNTSKSSKPANTAEASVDRTGQSWDPHTNQWIEPGSTPELQSDTSGVTPQQPSQGTSVGDSGQPPPADSSGSTMTTPPATGAQSAPGTSSGDSSQSQPYDSTGSSMSSAPPSGGQSTYSNDQSTTNVVLWTEQQKIGSGPTRSPNGTGAHPK